MSTMDRRTFLGALGGSLTVLLTVDAQALLAGPDQQGRGYPSDFNAYLRIGENGRVSLFTGKIEMGQGVHTSLAQMLAEELDVPLSAIDPVMGDTDLCPWDMGTFGSMTTRFFGPPLRAAGAEAKAVLLQLASERLNVPVARLGTRAGTVFDRERTAVSIAYGELVRGQKIERHITGVAPEPLAQHTVCNVPTPRLDARLKVTGEAQYAGDIRLPGMQYAAVLRPPAHGATLAEVDASPAAAVPGARVVRDGELVAVLHEQPDLAVRALERVQARWDVPEPLVSNQNLFEHLLAEPPAAQVVEEHGSIEAGLAQSVQVEEATYYNQYVAHAPIETHTALAQLEGGKLTVWASTQTPFSARDEIARAVGLAPENVRVITPFVGGGFGGKTFNLQAVEAARVAKLAGVPVQVMWQRREEFFYDRFRPAAVVRVRAGLDGSNRLALWELETLYAGNGASEPLYGAPHVRVTARGGWQGRQARQPHAVGPWRAPAANTNVHAAESHMDRMAAAAGADPVSFRLAHLVDERAKRALRAAAERFGGSFAPAPSRRGIGCAVAAETGAFVAAIAQVAVDERTGRIRVARLVCAQDMGEVINPQGATLQVEGCLTMGLGYALSEEVQFRGGQILDENFGSYTLPRFSAVPRIEVVLVENPAVPPQGGGEPAITVVGAVLANAVYDACGARLLELPMTPARVLRALAAS